MKKSDRHVDLHVVKAACKSGWVLVSTVRIPESIFWDEEWETMVFRSNPEGKVSQWRDLDRAKYGTSDQAKEGHRKMLTKWDSTPKRV